MPFLTMGRKKKKIEINTIKKSTQKAIETGTRRFFAGVFFAVLRGAVFRWAIYQ